MKSIKKAIKIIGTQVKMSKLLGIKASQIHKWLLHIRLPSVRNAIKIEEVTNGQVKAIDILNEKMEIKLKKMQKKVK